MTYSRKEKIYITVKYHVPKRQNSFQHIELIPNTKDEVTHFIYNKLEIFHMGGKKNSILTDLVL